MARRNSLVDLSSRRRRTRRLLFWGGILFALILLAGGAVWVIARSALFRIREIRVTGAAYVSPDEIRDFARAHAASGPVDGFLGAENIFAWPGEFPETDIRTLPEVTSLRVEKDYFHRVITLVAAERRRIGLWCFMNGEPEQCFWFDDAGILFLPGYSAEGNLIPVLDDYSRPPLALGDAALDGRTLANLLTVFSALRSLDVSVREVRLSDLSLQEVEADTYEGPKLFFSLRFPAGSVADAIASIERTTSLANLQYVDFRVQNKVYYK